MASQNPAALAGQLQEWAFKEMHFYPKGKHVNSPLPTEEDFRAICRGPMVDVWKFVLAHVKSAQTVQTIRGNLSLKSKQASKGYQVKYKSSESYSEERAALIEKRKQLSRELASTLANIGNVDKDLDRIRKDVFTTESQYQEKCNEIKNLQKRTTILQTQSMHVHDELLKHEEYLKRITHKVDSFRNLAKKGTEDVLYSKQQNNDGDAQSLETACTRNVRETCEHVGSFLHHLLKGSFSDDKALMLKRKEILWQKSECLMAEFPVEQILHSLCINANDSAISLHERTARIDIKKDVERLRFKYESSGQLKDVSSQDFSLQSVHQLLEEAHANNIKRFIETEKCKNHSWKLQQRLNEATELLDNLLKHRYKDDPGALELARKLLQAEIQTAADRSTLRTLHESVEVLKEQIARGMREKEILYTKYQKIQDFGKLADSKQNLIHVLVKQNVNSRSRLQCQQQEICCYVEKSLQQHSSETQTLAAVLNNAVSVEVGAFLKLPMHQLLTVMIDGANKVAVSDLSINQTCGIPNTSATHALQQILSAIEFPLYKAPECIMERVVELQVEINQIEASLRHQSAQGRSLELCGDQQKSVVEEITRLCKEVEKHDSNQVDTVLPMLQKRLAQATQALSHCLDVKDVVSVWWEQPAQNACSWVMVDDNNFRQWKDKWTVAVTRLRQIQLQTNKQ